MTAAAPADPTPHPFIIWTQRRTGGTTLMALLVACSGLTPWQDEAFNGDRELGAITRRFEADADPRRMADSVAEAASHRRLLKHTIETVPWQVTRALLRSSREQAYRHIVLLRRNETERQLSLALAEQTGIWGPAAAGERYASMLRAGARLPPLDLTALQSQLDGDAATLGRLLRALTAEQPYRLVFFEDLFTGALEQRRSAFASLAEFLQLPPRPPADPVVDEALLERAQNSRAIHGLLPNLAAATALIERWT